MSIIPSGLYDQYKEMADLFIDEINPGYITLYYPSTIATASSGLTPVGSFGELTMADRGDFVVPMSDMPDAFDKGVSTQYKEVPVSESLKCRVYWLSKNWEVDLHKLGAGLPTDICKVIVRIEDAYKLNNATHGVIDNTKVNMIRPPLSYGLGYKMYAFSYWQRVT